MTKQKIFNHITTGSVFTLIGSAFYMASRSFVGVDMVQAEIAILAVLSFASCAWLLSSVLPTIIELCKYGYFMSAGVTAALGVFLLTLEITLTKTGFGWLQTQTVVDHIVFNDGVTTIIAAGLSVFNIFAKWSFVSAMDAVQEIKELKAIESARKERRAARLEKEIAREKAGLEPKKGKQTLRVAA